MSNLWSWHLKEHGHLIAVSPCEPECRVGGLFCWKVSASIGISPHPSFQLPQSCGDREPSFTSLEWMMSPLWPSCQERLLTPTVSSNCKASSSQLSPRELKPMFMSLLRNFIEDIRGAASESSCPEYKILKCSVWHPNPLDAALSAHLKPQATANHTE